MDRTTGQEENMCIVRRRSMDAGRCWTSVCKCQRYPCRHGNDMDMVRCAYGMTRVKIVGKVLYPTRDEN